MERQTIAKKWQEFFSEYEYDSQAIAVADSFPEKRSLWVLYEDMDLWDSQFLGYIFDHPEEALSIGEDVLLESIPVDLLELIKRSEKFSPRIHLRIKGFPGDRFVDIRDIRHDHVGRFLGVSGIVKRVSVIRPRLLVGAFRCARCGRETMEEQDGLRFVEPQICDAERGGCGKNINQTTFRLLQDKCRYIDTQYIEIQEEMQGLRGGAQPQSLHIWLEDDLVGVLFPGDRSRISGVLKASQKRKGSEKLTQFDIHLEGISIAREKTDYDAMVLTDEDMEEITLLKNDSDLSRKIRESIAPTIHGYNEVKDALALQLFGGVEKEHEGGTRSRGDIHILLIGDPGTAKSQLLRQVSNIAPRGIYASGKGASSAGLTAAAVKDEGTDGRWTLEAGVLVLADRGTACVDELDKMTTQDRSSMHEAMEQQSYHPLTDIQLSDGRSVKIGEFVDMLMLDRHQEVVDGINCEILPLNASDFEVHSTDMQKIFVTAVDRVSRHVAPKHFINIRYSNGREIVVTPEHPVFVVGKEIFCIPASEVKMGDVVPAPKKIPGGQESEEQVTIQSGEQDVSPVSDIGRLEVVEVRIIQNEGLYRADYVYDVTVEPNHTFISQGVVLHNTVTVAKAGITATLQSRCSLLGAANPKKGRFDEFATPVDQIDMPPTLLSRFDLVFPMSDRPGAQDEGIADHILSVHEAGAAFVQHRKKSLSSIIDPDILERGLALIAPPVDVDLLRKYVGYAREHCYPVLTPEAKSRVKEFYLELRKKGEKRGSAVPITARQLEAMIRICEASARMRLSDVVTEEDADRAINIMKFFLSKLASDDGMGDIDRVMSPYSHRQRGTATELRSIILEMIRDNPEGAEKMDILAEAENRGFAREEAETILEKLTLHGELYCKGKNRKYTIPGGR